MNAFMLAKKLVRLYKDSGYISKEPKRVVKTTGTAFGNILVEEGAWYFQVNEGTRATHVVGAVVVHKDLEVECTGFGHAPSGRELSAVLGKV